MQKKLIKLIATYFVAISFQLSAAFAQDTLSQTRLHIPEAILNFGADAIGSVGVKYSFEFPIHPQVSLGLRTGWLKVGYLNQYLNRYESGNTIPFEAALFLGRNSFTLEISGGASLRRTQYGTWVFPSGYVGLRFLNSRQRGGGSLRAGGGFFQNSIFLNDTYITALTPYASIAFGYAIVPSKK